MRNKIVTADEAVAVIRDGDTIANSGFVGISTPDELLAALERRFLETGSPRDLGLVFAAGQGDGKDRGLNRLSHRGLIRRAVGGHWGLVPKLAALAVDGTMEAYNLPQGCISHLYRAIAGRKPGLLSKVGLGTFVDPRLEGGRINDTTPADLVEVMTVGGEEWLFYRAFPIQIAFLRATTACPAGNLTMEREALTLDALAMATAVRASGGLVIAQVERIAETGSLDARQVKVPGVMVDCVVVADPEHHPQTYATRYDPAFSAEIRRPLGNLPVLAMSERKIIARRAALELRANQVVNLGIGMPEGVAAVAAEEKVLKYLTLTAEPGVIGGLPASGLDFGAAVNTDAVIDQNQQFDFYDGGGLDLACLGMAEADGTGNVNVSRFGPKLAGAGGFINISQNARRLLFVGTFTAGGLDVRLADGRLEILREGRARKFVDAVQQITFSGRHAVKGGQPVLYITERAVFRLDPDGLRLAEVAPGIDVERDVLALMDFAPIVDRVETMDERIFDPAPMGLEDLLIDIPLADRIVYDRDSETLFLNFEGLSVRTPGDVRAVEEAVAERCKSVGKPVRVIVNYDNFHVSDVVLDLWAAMSMRMSETYYADVRRYTTSAFMRLKLGEALSVRGASPHVFESRQEAQASADRG